MDKFKRKLLRKPQSVKAKDTPSKQNIEKATIQPARNSLTDIANKYSHICNHSLNKDIEVLPWGKRSVHDIRLRFEIPTIWNYLTSMNYNSNSGNQDIYFLNGEENNIKFSGDYTIEC